MSAAGAEAVTRPVATRETLLRVAIARKVYRRPKTEDVEAVRGLAFEVGAREITCLIGPSGAGKTTSLRILLGLDRDFEGTVEPDPARLGVAMVFQDQRLQP